MLAFLCDGQGSQYKGMGKELCEKIPYFKKEISKSIECGIDYRKLLFDENIDINDTQNAQAAIYIVSVALGKTLIRYGIKPDYILGSSLGEYSALAIADAIDFKEGLNLVKKRGFLMTEYLKDKKSGMLQVIGADDIYLSSLIKNLNLNIDIGIKSSTNITILSGYLNELETIDLHLISEGFVTKKLFVSGAFHSRIMKDFLPIFKPYLDKLVIKKPKFPIVYNSTASEVLYTDIKTNLLNQIADTVNLKDGIAYLISKNVDEFIEIGAKKSMINCVNSMFENKKTYSINNYSDFLLICKDFDVRDDIDIV